MRIKEVETDEDVVYYMASVISPLSYAELAMDPTKENAAEAAEHALVGTAILGTAVFATWAISGGGASMGMWFGATTPTMFTITAVKIDMAHQTAQGTANLGRAVAASPYARALGWLGLGLFAYIGILETIQYGIQDVWLGDFAKNDTRGGSEHGLFYSPQTERNNMNVCSSCKEPDHPLDDESGLCYTCWLVACYESSKEEEE